MLERPRTTEKPESKAEPWQTFERQSARGPGEIARIFAALGYGVATNFLKQKSGDQQSAGFFETVSAAMKKSETAYSAINDLGDVVTDRRFQAAMAGYDDMLPSATGAQQSHLAAERDELRKRYQQIKENAIKSRDAISRLLFGLVK